MKEDYALRQQQFPTRRHVHRASRRGTRTVDAEGEDVAQGIGGTDRRNRIASAETAELDKN